jgi:hypothetical protein
MDMGQFEAINSRKSIAIMTTSLFNNAYQDKQKEEIIFKQYQLYVEMADKISNRRAISNSFFLGINAALISLISYVHSFSHLLNVAGFILSILWFNIVQSYKKLNSAKYEIINNIEDILPLKPYSFEWQKLSMGKNKKNYWPITHIETLVPCIFLLIYALPAITYLVGILCRSGFW